MSGVVVVVVVRVVVAGFLVVDGLAGDDAVVVVVDAVRGVAVTVGTSVGTGMRQGATLSTGGERSVFSLAHPPVRALTAMKAHKAERRIPGK
ncbi:hypothetical protein SK854_45665 [Lentzea sp. BCCO 10_0061]|uniref:Secreted protein n=1 Tax=Lentzea sokolovensis TaxID=3095429 RepID=A0ABU4VE66_9PSEU|nr:hypothetical protein [Lentzea sp. BCCO 10_0061]MDX8149479.1 hypothetical protein [Lentzea sp. BCCO 10_0061]